MRGYYNLLLVKSVGNIVVEDLVLRGYYNVGNILFKNSLVVEDLVLRGYYNSIQNSKFST